MARFGPPNKGDRNKKIAIVAGVIIILLVLGALGLAFQGNKSSKLFETGTTTITVAAGQSAGSSTITFPTAFKSTPIPLQPLVNNVGTVAQTYTREFGITTYSTAGSITFDKVVVAGDAIMTVSPGTFTIAITPAVANEWFVLNTAASNDGGADPGSVTSVTDTDTNHWFFVQGQTSPSITALGPARIEQWVAFVPSTSADTITVQWTFSSPNDYAGGIVSAYKGVFGIGYSATNSGTSNTASVTVPNIVRASDWVVFGTTAPQLGVAPPCVVMNGGTFRGNDNTNCAANGIVNFDLIDKIAPGVGSFGANDPLLQGGFPFSDDWAMDGVELVVDQSPDTLITTGTLYAPITFSNNGVLGITTVFTLSLDCLASNNPGATITFTLQYATDATQQVVSWTTLSTITGAAGSVCNGVTQTATPSVTSNLGPWWRLVVSCTSCNGSTAIEFSGSWLASQVNLNASPVVRVLSVTATQETVNIVLTGKLMGGVTFTVTWQAYLCNNGLTNC